MALTPNTPAGARLTTSYATVYTCPAGSTATVTLCQLANVTTASAYASIQWLDASAANAAIRLVNSVTIGPNTAITAVEKGAFTLNSGDALQALASALNAIELTLCVLERPNA